MSTQLSDLKAALHSDESDEKTSDRFVTPQHFYEYRNTENSQLTRHLLEELVAKLNAQNSTLQAQLKEVRTELQKKSVFRDAFSKNFKLANERSKVKNKKLTEKIKTRFDSHRADIVNSCCEELNWCQVALKQVLTDTAPQQSCPSTNASNTFESCSFLKCSAFLQYLRETYSGKEFTVDENSFAFQQYGNSAFGLSLTVEEVSNFVSHCCKSGTKVRRRPTLSQPTRVGRNTTCITYNLTFVRDTTPCRQKKKKEVNVLIIIENVWL